MESTKSNEAIYAKIEVAVRIKPLGAGAGEIVHPCEKFASKMLGEIDADKANITIVDKANS